MNANFRYEEVLRPYRIFQEGGRKYYKKKGKKVRIRKGQAHPLKKIKRITATFKNRDLVKSLQGQFNKSLNRTTAGRDIVNTTQYVGAIYKTQQDLNEQVNRQRHDLDSLEALLDKTRKSGKIVDLTTLLTKPEAKNFYDQLIAQGFGPQRAEEEFIKKFPDRLAQLEDDVEKKRQKIETLEFEGIEAAIEAKRKFKKQMLDNDIKIKESQIDDTRRRQQLSRAQKDLFRATVTGTQKVNKQKIFFDAVKDIGVPNFAENANTEDQFYSKIGKKIRQYNEGRNEEEKIEIKNKGPAKVNSAYTFLQKTNPNKARDLKAVSIPGYIPEPRDHEVDDLREQLAALRKILREEYAEAGNGKMMKEGDDSGGGLWNYEIDKIMKPYKQLANFQGTFPREDVGPLMDKMGKQFSFIFNTSRTDDPPDFQKHWMVMCASGDGALELYNPLGMEPISQDVVSAMNRYMKRQNILMKPKLNKKSDQSAYSDSCGWICIRFLLERFCLKWPFAVASRFKTIKQSEEGIKVMEKDFGYV